VQVDNDGTRLAGDRFSVGSGSTFAYSVLDTGYRKDLTIEEAVELGKRAIYHATHRDAYSGGIINVFVITHEGWKKMFSADMNDLHYGQYAKEREQEDRQRGTASRNTSSAQAAAHMASAAVPAMPVAVKK
jgi:20S proteasome subunit beta 5